MKSPLVLAFIGDAVLELKVRLYYAQTQLSSVNQLQSATSKLASAQAHYVIMQYLLENELLTEEEISIFKKGRNTKVNPRRKNFNSRNYHYSTGFEAMIGYLYYENKEERIDELVKIIIERIDV